MSLETSPSKKNLSSSSTSISSLLKTIALWLIVISLSLVAYGVGLKLGRDYKAKRDKLIASEL